MTQYNTMIDYFLVYQNSSSHRSRQLSIAPPSHKSPSQALGLEAIQSAANGNSHRSPLRSTSSQKFPILVIAESDGGIVLHLIYPVLGCPRHGSSRSDHSQRKFTPNLTAIHSH
jgi:hypothetical protein